MIVSVFENHKAITGGKMATVNAVLESIRCEAIKDRIEAIRNEPNIAQRRVLKSQLPCICFAGIFETRKDSGCTQHSGFAILDIDHIGDEKAVNDKKEEIKKFPFVYACFVSPSGDGLKVLAKIPPSIEKHRGYYRGLMQLFPQLDSTSINISRVCYASSDKDIYVNKKAVEFDTYIEELQPEKTEVVVSETVDYSKLNIPAKMIRDSQDGEKHAVLLKAAKLCGGYIAGGLIYESDAINMLEDEIRNKGVDDFKLAQKTIRDGIDFGKRQPISDIVVTNDASKYIAAKEEADSYITAIRNNTFKMGLTTGIKSLDEYWRFKDANFVIINGFDNVGKSVVLWYLSMLSAILHDWRWIIHAGENKIGGVKRKLIEFYLCKSVKAMSEDELNKAMSFVEDHYTFIANDEILTYRDMLSIHEDVNKEKHHNAMLLDPYNSLFFPEGKDRHEWDYRAANEMRSSIKKTQCSIFLNCHVITEASRRKYPPSHQYAGHPMPPDKSDTEGGTKFSNRADDFMTIHRMVYHTEWMITEVYVRKVKEMETGGMPTQLDNPVKLRSVEGVIGFTDMDGYNPILKTQQPRVLSERVFKPNVHPDKFIAAERDDEDTPF